MITQNAYRVSGGSWGLAPDSLASKVGRCSWNLMKDLSDHAFLCHRGLRNLPANVGTEDGNRVTWNGFRHFLSTQTPFRHCMMPLENLASFCRGTPHCTNTPVHALRLVRVPFLTYKFSCRVLGTASELRFGNRVIERKPLDESFPCKDSLANSQLPAVMGVRTHSRLGACSSPGS